ncbi:MAG: hypothetical protein LBC67_07205 [Spirochaetales bacterium]|jgi:hypothetical protein|nr:hypothetical protein [Spirochaetales bacterium]
MKTKTFSLTASVCTVFITLCLASCFSGYTGEYGYFVIGPAANGAASYQSSPPDGPEREEFILNKSALPADPELAAMRYVVDLTGPGGTKKHEQFSEGGGRVRLARGDWTAAVKAYNGQGLLRGFGEKTFTITGDADETVSLKSVIGVSTEAELTSALNGSLAGGAYLDGNDNDNYIVLIQNIVLTGGAAINLAPGKKFIIMAEPGTTKKITRVPSSKNAYFNVAGANTELTLGRPGERGALVFDGDLVPGVTPFQLKTGGKLTIEGNTEITRCVSVDGSVNGGAVYVGGTSELILNRGKLTLNQYIPMTGDAKGGAVFVDDDGQLNFSMGPVEISGNLCKAESPAGASGGGIYIGKNVNVNIPSGGNIAITDNTVETTNSGSASGGGIFCKSSLDLPAGLTIRRNKAVNSDSMGSMGGGVSISVNSGAISVNIKGALITDNEAEITGGGVFLNSGGTADMTVNMTGGRISGNKLKTPDSSSFPLGGGIYINTTSGGVLTCTISGGFIEDNEAVNTGTGSASGGGVYAGSIDFILEESALIAGNTVRSGSATIGPRGGGIFFSNSVTYSLSGGRVTNNTVEALSAAPPSGGGIFRDVPPATVPAGGTDVSGNWKIADDGTISNSDIN